MQQQQPSASAEPSYVTKLQKLQRAYFQLGDKVVRTAELLAAAKSRGGRWTAAEAAEGEANSRAFVAFGRGLMGAFRHLGGAADAAQMSVRLLGAAFAELLRNPEAIAAMSAAAEDDVQCLEDACDWLEELAAAWVASGELDKQEYYLEILDYDQHGLQVVFITKEMPEAIADQQHDVIETSLDHLVRVVIANDDDVVEAAGALACAFGRGAEEDDWADNFTRALSAQVEAAHLLHRLVAHELLQNIEDSLKVPEVRLQACHSLASVKLNVARLTARGRLLASQEAAGEDEGGKAAGGSDEADPDAGSVPQPQAGGA